MIDHFGVFLVYVFHLVRDVGHKTTSGCLHPSHLFHIQFSVRLPSFHISIGTQRTNIVSRVFL